MKFREKYPKNISFYLDKDKNSFVSYFSFIEEDLEQKNRFLSAIEKKKIKEKNNYEQLKKNTIFRYFHPQFLNKADSIIKDDKQKESFLLFINRIMGGYKEYFTQEKLYINKNFIYSIFTTKEEKLKIKVTFCIFFEKSARILPYNTYIQKIYFFDICKEKDAPEKNISKFANEFENNFLYGNNDLEFDKMIYLGDMKQKLFYQKYNTDGYDIKHYYYFFPYEIKTKNEIFKVIKIFDKEYLQGFDPSIWELKYPINNVLKKLSNIDKFNYNSFFEKDVLDFHPSKMETKLINMNDNFILSGRPGTGKTVIILIKIIMSFLRCIYEHSAILKGDIDFNFINNVILKNLFNPDIDDINKEDDTSEENHVEKIINENKKDKMIDNIISDTIKEKIENNKTSNEENKDDDEEEDENSENTIQTKTQEILGNEGGTYKIIFTSLSQSLCAFAENSFIRGIKRTSNIICEIYPTSQKTYEKMSSFVYQQKYPLFINFRKLIFMIDGSLNFQFFDRPNKNKLRKRQDDCDIRFYPDCEYDVMVNLSFMTYRPGNIYFYRREYLEDPLVMTEINEDTFYNNFNSQIKSNKILNNEKSHISTYEVYSNIISIIKGSIKSYLVGALSIDDYLAIGKKVCPFDSKQKNEIYKIFEQYEYWKYKNNYFDFQDVVNYLIREVNIELVPQNRKIFDLVFIDEVQDFSINQLYLLFLISRDIKVLAGDTCQTISKINTFRFADLNNVIYTFGAIKNIKINEPKIIEINLNYRCQANILRFAHFIYEMIRTFFSHTLDKVRMDFSTQVGGGEKPYLIPTEIKVSQGKLSQYKNLTIIENKTGFDYFLKGLTENNLFLDDPKSIINISFSVNHCVICRNNEVVKKLNKKYNNKIFCSTAYESKGLEYEIVILYNFFNDSLPFVKEIWTYILKNINVNQIENNYLYLIKENLDFEGFPSSIKDQIYSIFNKKFNIEVSNEFKNQFSIYNFCSELKELYVAITRAKNRLYIYEEDKEILRLFMNKIYNFDIISQEVYNKKVDEDNKDKFKLLINKEDNYNLLNKKVIGCIKFINNSRLTKEKLLKTAYDEYNQDNEYNYKKSLYLFQVINEETMKTKCLINLKFIEMQKLKGTNNQAIKDKFISLNKEIIELVEKINFDDNKQIKGEVLINLERYDEALDYFISKDNFKKCGIVLIKKKEYENALSYFIKGKEYSFAVNCLIELKNYQRLYDFLLEYKEEFDLEHIQYFYKITCDKFFQKYVIPIKDNKKGFKTKKAKKSNDDNEKKEPEGGYVNINYDLDKKSFDKIFFDEKYNLYDFIQNDKIKIKSPFILISEPNSAIFALEETEENKNNIFTIQKTKEQLIYLISTFKELLNFMLVYLQIIITKTEKNNNQELFIEKSKEIILDIETKIIKESTTNKELIESMEKLVIKKHEFKAIIIGILKNIEAKEFIYDLYEINIFKINILEHIQKDLPITTKNFDKDYIDKELLSREMITQLVSYSKYLPIKEDDIIFYLRFIFIRSYNLGAIIGITKKDDLKSLLDISLLIKKQKLFEYIIKLLDIDFVKGKINNKSYKNVDISKYEILHYMNAYLNMLMYKFFKYFLSTNRDYTKINTVLQKIKIFPQIYEILNIIIKEKEKIINFSSLIDDVNEIDCDDILNFENKDIDMKKYLKLIAIINKINIIKYILCFHKISLKFNFPNNISENTKIFDYYVKNYANILDMHNYLKENIEKKNENNDPSPYINVIMENKKHSFCVKEKWRSSSNWNYKFNDFFQKNEYLSQNDKSLDYSINKTNKVILKINDFIIGLENSNCFLKKELFNYLEENQKEKEYIKSKYLLILDKELLINIFQDKSNIERIIKSKNEFYYLGEYPINNDEIDNYIAQFKLIFDSFNGLYEKNLFGQVMNKVLSNDNKNKDKISDLINYILFTNLIGGGYMKINYNGVLKKYDEISKDIKNLKDIYLNKEFSYFEAFKSLLYNYGPKIDQLMAIIWLRKIYNIIYTILLDDKNKDNIKLYIDKNKNDIKLNVYEIRQYISKISNFDIIDFIDKYFSILSSFIKNIKANKDNIKDILSEIKIYFSEIYYSLKTILSNVKEKIKIKIKLTLEQMENVPFLLYDTEDILKEITIINDDKLMIKEVIYLKMYERYLNINRYDGEDDNYDNDYEDDDYSEDYDELEENLVKNKGKGKDY